LQRAPNQVGRVSVRGRGGKGGAHAKSMFRMSFTAKWGCARAATTEFAVCVRWVAADENANEWIKERARVCARANG
jgi:hypothetical protein